MGGHGECLGPILSWHRRLEKESTYYIVGGAYGTLSFAILWRSVGARKAHDGAVRMKI